MSKPLTTSFALAAVAAAWFGAAANAVSQETAVLRGAVRSTNGVTVVNARVSLVAGVKDTTLRTNANGNYAVVLPVGRIRVAVTMIGYQPFEQEVFTTGDTTFDVVMHAVPQQVAGVDVRESWIGIRGVVGDEETMKPLAGVQVRSIKRNIRVFTDSLGRFEFSLPKAERTSLQLTLDNYKSRPAMVSLEETKSANITVLLTRGTDPNHMKHTLLDLDRRLGWGGMGMFVANAEILTRHGAQTLAEGLLESGMLARKGLVPPPDTFCVFVDGIARPDIQPQSIPVAGVDFVEVWGVNTDDTGTFAARWPGRTCRPQRAGSRRADGPWLGVWMKAQRD
jgi:hypothetical protein